MKKIAKNFLIYLFIALITFSFTQIEILASRVIFFVPFVLFLSLLNYKYSYFSLVIGMILLQRFQEIYLLSGLLLFVGMVVFKGIKFYISQRIEVSLAFFAFLISALNVVWFGIFDKSIYLFECFLSGIISYWLMIFYYRIYKRIKETSCFDIKESVFLFFLFGALIVGLNMNIKTIDFSFIIILVCIYISSRISFSLTATASFLISLMMINSQSPYVIAIFFCVSIAMALIAGTSRISSMFFCSVIIGIIMYYYKFEYTIAINFLMAFLMCCFISDAAINDISSFFLLEEKQIEKMKSDSKKKQLEITYNLSNMREVLKITQDKLKGIRKIKNNDKKFLEEEMKNFEISIGKYEKEITRKYVVNDSYYFNKLEHLFSKYDIDLLYFSISKNIMNKIDLKVSIRGEKKELESIVIPILNKEFQKNFAIEKIKYNTMFSFYELWLGSKKSPNLIHGVAQIAKDDEVCGDSYLVFEKEEKRYYVLSDGMGSGKKAKKKSLEAIELLKKFIEIGFEEKEAIKSVNYLLGKEHNKDNYATLDLLVYDKASRELLFFKNGAYNSFVIRGSKRLIIEGERLPLGIVENIEIKAEQMKANNQDWILMVSDGASKDVEQAIKNIKGNNPQKRLREILKKQNKEIEDDKTMILIQIKE